MQNYFSISIHASTRGATSHVYVLLLPPIISIHASTRGATFTPNAIAIISSYFNPRFHERSDYPNGCPTVFPCNFNPRFHERSDVDLGGYFLRSHLFQSTLPREERQKGGQSQRIQPYFNPRFHERSDGNIAQKICLFLYNTDNKYIIR